MVNRKLVELHNLLQQYDKTKDNFDHICEVLTNIAFPNSLEEAAQDIGITLEHYHTVKEFNDPDSYTEIYNLGLIHRDFWKSDEGVESSLIRSYYPPSADAGWILLINEDVRLINDQGVMSDNYEYNEEQFISELRHYLETWKFLWEE